MIPMPVREHDRADLAKRSPQPVAVTGEGISLRPSVEKKDLNIAANARGDNQGQTGMALT